MGSGRTGFANRDTYNRMSYGAANSELFRDGTYEDYGDTNSDEFPDIERRQTIN